MKYQKDRKRRNEEMATKLSFDWKFDKTGYPRYLNRKARLFQVVGEIKDPKSDSDHLTTDDLLVEKGYVVGDDVYIYKDEIKLSNETAKTTLLYDGVYHIDYLDLETLTHQFYAISNNIHVS